jgi:acyl-CoA reductase-like NAD-dependent aldehyde dehydrogenase/nicotinamidase-related amidase
MKPALLLVDLQGDFLNQPELQPPRTNLIHGAARLLEIGRQNQWPIFHVMTTVHDEKECLPHWRLAERIICRAGTLGHAAPGPLQPVNGEPVLHKRGFNVFRTDRLERVLSESACKTVVLAGVHLHTCIRLAAMECIERGYNVVIAEDATGSNDPVHAAAVRRWLADRCVRFENTTRILDSFRESMPGRLIHHSPRCPSQTFEVPIMASSEIDDAVGHSQAFLKQWQRVSVNDRLNKLDVLADRLEKAAKEFAQAMAVQIGKPFSQGLEEIRRAAMNIRDVARRCAAHSSVKFERAGRIRYRPHGVVAIIAPWNNPVAIPLGKIAPALAYGNAVVWKPAPAATQIAQLVSDLMRDSDLPSDAAQFVTGNHSTAQLLASHKNVDAVTFTGSTRSGYALQELCGRLMRPLQAELGGNNAAIVWDDADLAHAANEIARGAFAFAGQRCTANRRVIISDAIFEAFLSQLKIAAARMIWDDPLKTETEIGPVIDAAKREEIDALAASAEHAGFPTTRPPQQSDGSALMRSGYYVAPVTVCCDQADHPLVQEESMGPVLVVQRARDFDQALALCNGVRHGLLAALFTSCADLQHKFQDEARAGMLKLNTSTAGVDVTLPFGGWKASGIGPPEHGESDALFYLRPQAVYGDFPA